MAIYQSQKSVAPAALTSNFPKYLSAHGSQIVASRKVIDIRAQRGPVFFCLTTVVPLRHHLIDAARTVHYLLHLCLCFKIIRCWVELASKAVCGAIQIVHGIFKVVFCLLGLVRSSVWVC